MTPPTLTGSALAAWHRSEADRIEAEERARRPALAAGQVWRYVEGPETNRFWCILVHVRGELLAVSDRGAVLYDFLFGIPKGFELVGSLARDVLRVVAHGVEDAELDALNALKELEALYRGTSQESREMNTVLRRLDAIRNPPVVVPPDPEAMKTYGAEALGTIQVAPEPTGAELVGRRCWVRHDLSPEWQDRIVQKYDPAEAYCYGTHPGFPPYASGSLVWWKEAKPYVEGVAP